MYKTSLFSNFQRHWASGDHLPQGESMGKNSPSKIHEFKDFFLKIQSSSITKRFSGIDKKTTFLLNFIYVQKCFLDYAPKTLTFRARKHFREEIFIKNTRLCVLCHKAYKSGLEALIEKSRVSSEILRLSAFT